MSRKILVCFFVVTVMSFVSVTSFAKPDFNGSWILNKDRSIGLQPGMDMAVTIKQEGDKLEVETKVVTTQQGEQLIKETFVLDAKEVEFTPTQPKSKGKRTAKWLDRGNGILVTDVITVETDKGTNTILIERKWVISPDGKELITDRFLEDQNGARIPVRRVFAKNTLK
jgi:hypothetical protein